MRRTLAVLLCCWPIASTGWSAAHAANQQGTKPLTDLVLVRVLFKPSGQTGWPVHSFYGQPIRAKYTLWYQNSAHWRVAGHYVTAPRDAFLLRNGSYGSPFFPFPGIVLRRDSTIWHYDVLHHRLTSIPAQSDGMNPMANRGNTVGLFLDDFAPGSIGDVIRHEDGCRTVKVSGTQRVAARQAYVIRLSANRCNSHSASGYAATGPIVAWVDRATLVLLRYDLYLPGGRTLLFRVRTARIIYGAKIKPSLLLPP